MNSTHFKHFLITAPLTVKVMMQIAQKQSGKKMKHDLSNFQGRRPLATTKIINILNQMEMLIS